NGGFPAINGDASKPVSPPHPRPPNSAVSSENRIPPPASPAPRFAWSPLRSTTSPPPSRPGRKHAATTKPHPPPAYSNRKPPNPPIPDSGRKTLSPPPPSDAPKPDNR